ncbi:MAG: M20/M25/M40 family metallo-hydrolase [Acidobacteria bacterium]|nr:M20/M25/M40 family metallo-hydrolase [Acidobacteriota bacterium]
MNRTSLALVLLLSIASLAAQAPESVDAAAIQKIREQGLNQSQVMETLFYLTDVHGPRLTGSPGFEAAGDWAVERLKSWGFTNAHKERWDFGTGWSLDKFHATMTAPQTMPINAMPKAWSAGTNGPVSAEVVRPQITNAAEAEQWKGKLRGKIVLTQDARQVNMLEGRLVLRMTDKEIEEAMMMPPPPAARAGGAGGRGGGAGGRGGRGGQGGEARFNVNDFYQAEGVVALFDRGSNSDTAAGGSDLSWRTQKTDGGTFSVGSGGSRVADQAGTGLPQVTLAVEHYNRMVRLLDHDIPVKIKMNIEVSFRPETASQPNGFNVIADFPGTDLADEIVLVGGHFDSWHAATGATDNATGSSAMMEVLRIIKDAGLRPRRTIRVALWGGEEQGLIGSRLYAEQYLGTADAPKPGHAKHSAYYNIDNGTGKVRGIWMQSNPKVAPIFGAWIVPLKDLGVEILGPRNVSSTDHSSIDRTGVPGFQFVQERLEYNSRTHHTNMDFYDRVQADDLKQTATVAAVFAYQTAMRDAKLPRK